MPLLDLLVSSFVKPFSWAPGTLWVPLKKDMVRTPHTPGQTDKMLRIDAGYQSY